MIISAIKEALITIAYGAAGFIAMAAIAMFTVKSPMIVLAIAGLAFWFMVFFNGALRRR